MKRVQISISELGDKLVHCQNDCLGIINSHANGILPRCLIFQIEDKDEKSKGCVIVGINPGPASKEEKNDYMRNNCTYKAVSDYWEKKLQRKQYYKRLSQLVDELGFKGPILWSELVKCQNKNGKTLPPLQTFRTCTKKFLNKELEIVPSDWLIIAVGRETYKALAYIYPQRAIIGVNHPKARNNFFPEMFKKIEKLKLEIYKAEHEALAIWCNDILK